MRQVETRVSPSEVGTPAVKAPSVLVVLVTRDGRKWLPQCLLSLSKQTHPRLGVLAVDNDSSDGSADLLESALGAGRVVRLSRNAGFAVAVAEALRSDVAKHADYLLFLHDDTMLAPKAVASLVETSEKVGAGVVGPKVLDWEDPRVLRGIGLSTDRFGYPYSPLEEGEIDQGQYDRVREVRFVPSCAMLVSRAVWTKIGPPDGRFGHSFEADLDFCWRAQLAGFRVLMTPNAVVHHRGARERGERPGAPARLHTRYHNERVALASILKSYSLLSLAWILPLYFVQGGARIVLLALSRRFEDASQVLAAWGWNLIRLPDTIRLRVRAQAMRAVPDRLVRRSMAPSTIRLRQWAASAAGSLLPAPREEREPGRRGLVRFAVAHPVAVAWTVSLVLLLVADRNLLVASSLSGGGLGVVPGTPAGFFTEFVSGIRSTGLGGSQGASPALGLLGLGSVLTVGNPALLQKLLLLLLPVAGAVGCYRAVRSITRERISSVVAAGCYGLSGVALWSFSEGRLPVLVLLAGLPWLARKVSAAVDPSPPVSARRWIVGAGLGAAVLGAFFPAVALSGLLVAAGALATAPSMHARIRGASWLAAAALLATALAAPVTWDVVRAGSRGLADIGTGSSLADALRLGIGGSAGSWVSAFAFPAAAAVALVFVGQSFGRHALRAAITGLGGVYLGWAAGAGHLPAAIANAPAYLGVAAFEFALLIGLGLASLFPGVGSLSFGRRHLGAGLMAALLAIGLSGQAVRALEGSWIVGRGRIPAAYAVVKQSSSLPFRVLWVGRAGGQPFAAPGGVPDRNLSAGGTTVRFAVRLQSGASILDVGRPTAGRGYEALDRVLTDILAGKTQHGGALLAPFAISYIVASPGDLPVVAAGRLRAQLDLDRFPTPGLIILRNEKAVPLASVVQSPDWIGAARSGQPGSWIQLPQPNDSPLSGTDERYSGAASSGPGLVLLSQQFDGGWRLSGGDGKKVIQPRRAFGWAVGFDTPSAATPFTVRFGGRGAKRAEIALLAILWLTAIWMTRRPLRGR